MKNNEYVTTLLIKDKVINVGLDDYGQSYFFEWEKDGQLHSGGCGTYNFEFLEAIYSQFDYKGTVISLYGEEEWEDKIKHFENLRDSRPDDREYYDAKIEKMKNDSYEIYDFKSMYEKIRKEQNERHK